MIEQRDEVTMLMLRHFGRRGARCARRHTASASLCRSWSTDSPTRHQPSPSVETTPMACALQGIQVLSLEQAVAAPLCTARLAEHGARVIKVERPGVGDFGRTYDGYLADGELSSYFGWLNRGKQSLEADVKDPADLRLVHNILAKSDVFVQVFAVCRACWRDRHWCRCRGLICVASQPPRVITKDGWPAAWRSLRGVANALSKHPYRIHACMLGRTWRREPPTASGCLLRCSEKSTRR